MTGERAPITTTVADVLGNSGLMEAKIRRETGRVVTVYRNDEAGLDDDGGPYSTCCEDHGDVIAHGSLTLAKSHASNPLGWCEPCMDEHREQLLATRSVSA